MTYTPQNVSVSPNPVQMRENTDQKKTPNVDTFHAMVLTLIWVGFLRVRFLKLVKIMLLT